MVDAPPPQQPVHAGLEPPRLTRIKPLHRRLKRGIHFLREARHALGNEGPRLGQPISERRWKILISRRQCQDVAPALGRSGQFSCPLLPFREPQLGHKVSLVERDHLFQRPAFAFAVPRTAGRRLSSCGELSACRNAASNWRASSARSPRLRAPSAARK